MATNNEALDCIFRKVRTHSAWLNKPVDDAILKEVYDLAKMGPTSANMCPMRIVFVKSNEGKERLNHAQCGQRGQDDGAAGHRHLGHGR